MTADSLGTYDRRMQELVDRYKILRQAVIVSEEAVAAAITLMTWNLNANPKELQVRKISDSLRGSRLEATHLLKTFTMDAVQVRYEGYDSLYQLHLREGAGAMTTYNLIVRPLDAGYETSLMIGNNVVGTFKVELETVPGTRHSYRTKSLIEVIESE